MGARYGDYRLAGLGWDRAPSVPPGNGSRGILQFCILSVRSANEDGNLPIFVIRMNAQMGLCLTHQ